MRSTHTYVVLDISVDAYSEIEKKLRAADYHHCFGSGVIDMSGIAVAPGDGPKALMPPDHWVMRSGDNDYMAAGIDGCSSHRDAIRDAARQAIRAATGNGTILDFDPDALVIELLNRICGYSANLTEGVR